MKAIAAMDLNRGMGFRGKLPWHLPEDFKWFKQKTLETKKLVMGRETFREVGPLKDRFTYVLTSESSALTVMPPFSSYRYVGPDFFKTEPHDDIWLCGGAKTYTLLLPYCTEVYVTLVLNEYEVDTYMPPFEERFTEQTILLETKEFWIIKYSNPIAP